MNKIKLVVLKIMAFGIVLNFFVIEMALAEEVDYRGIVRSLATKYIFSHEEIDRSVHISMQSSISEFLDLTTPVSEIADGPNYFVEFFERAKLSKDSFIQVGERRLRLTCLWVKGSNRSLSSSNNVVLQKMIFTIGDDDCTGPIKDNGEQRWESYIEMIAYRPNKKQLKEGKLVYRGSTFALNLEQ